jgi:hypothetical protein
MELDDLRRQWQQPVPGDGPARLDAAAWAQLVDRGTQNAVAKLRRNAWLELGATVACLLLSCAALFYVEKPRNQVMLVWLIILCLVSVVSYHRLLLRGLQRLGPADATVREHLAQQLAGVRRIIRLSYLSGLWTLPVSFGIGFFFSLSSITAKYSGTHLFKQVGLLVVSTGIAGFMAYLLMRWVARKYFQDLYGQHLDRLEANLRELSDEDLA